MKSVIISNDKKARFVRIFVYTTFFMMLTHAYGYFNANFSHDSILINTFWSQFAAGRVFQPIYRLLRGGLSAPFLIGVMSTMWLAISIILLIELLSFKWELAIVLVCGLLSTSSTITLSNATYISFSDIFMLSLLLSIAGVYSVKKIRKGFLYAPFLIAASLALYQAYFQVAVALFMIDIIIHIIDEYAFKSVVQKALQYLFVLISALVIYYITYKIMLSITGITASESYNSVTKLKSFSTRSIPALLLNTYRNVANYFLRPETFGVTLVRITNITIFALTLLCILKLLKVRSINLINKIILIFVLILLPFGADIVFFLATFEHSLMTFSFVLFYVFALKIAELYRDEFKKTSYNFKCNSIKQFAVGLFGAIIIFNSVVFANQVYFKKELEYQATTAIMTRVLHHIEEMDSYTIGETPVAIIGELRQSPLAVKRPEFKHLSGVGLEGNLSLTYNNTNYWYLTQILGYPINPVPVSTLIELQKTNQVQQMPVYPNKGFCEFIDDILVIKFSN